MANYISLGIGVVAGAVGFLSVLLSIQRKEAAKKQQLDLFERHSQDKRIMEPVGAAMAGRR